MCLPSVIVEVCHCTVDLWLCSGFVTVQLFCYCMVAIATVSAHSCAIWRHVSLKWHKIIQRNNFSLSPSDTFGDKFWMSFFPLSCTPDSEEMKTGYTFCRLSILCLSYGQSWLKIYVFNFGMCIWLMKVYIFHRMFISWVYPKYSLFFRHSWILIKHSMLLHVQELLWALGCSSIGHDHIFFRKHYKHIFCAQR